MCPVFPSNAQEHPPSRPCNIDQSCRHQEAIVCLTSSSGNSSRSSIADVTINQIPNTNITRKPNADQNSIISVPNISPLASDSQDTSGTTLSNISPVNASQMNLSASSKINSDNHHKEMQPLYTGSLNIVDSASGSTRNNSNADVSTMSHDSKVNTVPVTVLTKKGEEYYVLPPFLTGRSVDSCIVKLIKESDTSAEQGKSYNLISNSNISSIRSRNSKKELRVKSNSWACDRKIKENIVHEIEKSDTSHKTLQATGTKKSTDIYCDLKSENEGKSCEYVCEIPGINAETEKVNATEEAENPRPDDRDTPNFVTLSKDSESEDTFIEYSENIQEIKPSKKISTQKKTPSKFKRSISKPEVRSHCYPSIIEENDGEVACSGRTVNESNAVALKSISTKISGSKFDVISRSLSASDHLNTK